MSAMDRRIQKTKSAIYDAFLTLLAEKGYAQTTVQDIIDLANVGRSTFYAHYESKEILLDQLCEDLFHHLFRQGKDLAFEDYIMHILTHFKEDRDCVASLLLSDDPYFIRKLKEELAHDVYPRLAQNYLKTNAQVPEAFKKQFVTSSFVDTLVWWLRQREEMSEKEVLSYYLQMIS